MADPRSLRPAPSLLARLLTGVVLILIVGAVVLALSTWFNGRRASWEAYDRLLLGAANDIAESIRIVEGAVVVNLPTSAFELLAQAPDDRIAYAVRDPGGTLVTGENEVAPPDRPRAAGAFFFDGVLQGESARFVEVPRRFAERDFSGTVQITVGQTMIARRALATDLMLNALVPMAAGGIALVLISIFVVRGAVRPLNRITDDMLRRDPYDLTPVDTAKVPREITGILLAMNRFMGRLDRQFTAMQSLISDTAHQLRTPVAAIRAQAETAIETTDAAERERLLERLAKRTRSLGTLLDQMLSRALVIHRTDSVAREVFDLRQIALDIIETRDHETLSQGGEIDLVLGESPVMVAAVEFSLVQAGKNLLTNALKHGAPPVRLGVDSQDGLARLWIEDHGKGMPAALSADLGKRFQRSAASREDSVGLGLSIVTAVAQAFDGSLSTHHDGNAFRVTLSLPLVEDP
ncbi:sensor histidine kinase [Maritimibacter sp. DP1N21-5]|uniref:sensor histidine kinase n=1 Tax=Maritimibacter sp. DP1N21-5 TaxID=2836867 RepID=UPI001C4500B0|nr:sensor histidine kinase [Maritimibacter sp. DP1N21-5]MBV7407804.1 sensor histidine kinase [Maritimibacter sp. DP1N21-5]